MITDPNLTQALTMARQIIAARQAVATAEPRDLTAAELAHHRAMRQMSIRSAAATEAAIAWTRQDYMTRFTFHASLLRALCTDAGA